MAQQTTCLINANGHEFMYIYDKEVPKYIRDILKEHPINLCMWCLRDYHCCINDWYQAIDYMCKGYPLQELRKVYSNRLYKPTTKGYYF